MLTPSEQLAKLSASVAELSQRAKEAEDHMAAARNEAQEELKAHAAEAKATAQRRREVMNARRAEVRDELASSWASLGAQMHEQFEKIRAKLDEKRDDHDAGVAERRAERAELNATDAVYFAIYAIDEAETAIYEAADARAIADALHPAA